MSDLALGMRLDDALRPGDTANAVLFTAETITEVTRIVICNTTGNAPTFRLFHVRGGEVADETTALYYDSPLTANQTKELKAEGAGGGYHLDAGDQLVVRSSAASEITFTAYGVTEQLAERTRT